MTIRRRLFLFLPLIVLIANVAAFSIYFSSMTIQSGYQQMFHHFLTYREIHEHAKSAQIQSDNYWKFGEIQSIEEIRKTKKFLEEDYQKIIQFEVNELIYHDLKHLETVLLKYVEKLELFISASERKTKVFPQSIHFEVKRLAEQTEMISQQLLDREVMIDQPVFKDIWEVTKTLNIYGILMLITSISLSVMISFWISRTITHSLKELSVAAGKIANGELEIALPDRYPKDELGSVYESFHHMVDNLRELLIHRVDSLEKDKLMKELELKALQSQIHPHFMFNTLNVISKLAYIEGADRTSELTVSVSNLFRYNLRRLDEPVSLRDEVENASEYFAIQKARFQDRVKMTQYIESEALDHLIPCLTLQPLLENAFVHGIEIMESGAELQLFVEKLKDRVRITISDNGMGMPESVRDGLLLSSESPVKGSSAERMKRMSTGIGTKNVFRRLRLFYDQLEGPESQQLIQIESAEHLGTSIILNLPYVTRMNREGV